LDLSPHVAELPKFPSAFFSDYSDTFLNNSFSTIREVNLFGSEGLETKFYSSRSDLLAFRKRHRLQVAMKLDLGYGYFRDPEPVHLSAYGADYFRYRRRTKAARVSLAQTNLRLRIDEIIRSRLAGVRYRAWKIDWARYQEAKARGENVVPPPLLDPKDYT